MDAAAQCVLPKLPLIRRNFTFTTEFVLPAPCWKMGAPPLVWLYLLIAVLLPVLALLGLNFRRIRDTCIRKMKKGDLLTCKRAVADADTEEKAEIAEDLQITAPAVDRLQLLAEARAKRSNFDVFVAEAISSETNLGQLLLAIGVLCSAISLTIYLVKVSKKLESLEWCGTLPNSYQIIDLIVNIYMLLLFILRLIGADRKQKVVTSMFSIVDYFTIPCVVLGVILDRYFTGFAFFRAYNFQWLVEILAHRRVLRSTNSVRLVKLILLVLAIILIAGGFLHLVENMGDPWMYDVDGISLYNGQSIVFYRCFLYVYGRITLLDLSGMRMHTMLGRVIIYGFQILALGIVARAIPQIIERVRIKPDYDKPYNTSPMFIHIVVCGHVQACAMEDFLKEFYHPDRNASEFFKVVLLSEKCPDDDMQSLQERYFSKLDYIRGTVMSLKDLNRVKLVEARATLIIADRNAPDTDAEDAANIMRSISIKNYKPDAQIIVQLNQYHNKAYLQNIPSWEPERGDIVICLAELRLGLLAQSCLAPGFSTLMANFFTTRSFEPKAKYSEPWLADYVRGTSLELYCRPFGEAFEGMTFTQACEFCYRRLKILLLAIQTDLSDASSVPQINPPATTIILTGTYAYLIADSGSEADRVQFYCAKCHADVEDASLVKRCDCGNENRLSSDQSAVSALGFIALQTSLLAKTVDIRNKSAVESKIWSYICRYPATPSDSLINLTKEPEKTAGDGPSRPITPTTVPQTDGISDCRYDSTGMFHWCPARTLKSATINRKKAAISTFKKHIVVCVLAQEKSQILGLSGFVLPLRSSVIPEEDVMDVVILGDVKFLEKEWKYLCNLPRLFVVKGTALNRSDLRSVNLNSCIMCVILGAPNTAEKVPDPTLLDKSVVLATLNVRAMRFSKDEGKVVSDDDEADNKLIQSKSVLDVPGQGTLSKQLSLQRIPSVRSTPNRSSGYDIPIITDLIRDSNAMFLDDEDTDLPGTEFYQTQPYASGRAFAASVLDLLMITSFFNPTITKVIHTIIFGGASLELERIMAEGAGLIGGPNISKQAEIKDQVSIVQESVEGSPLSIHAGSSYGGLFVDALCSMGLVVLGLYRRIDDVSPKRYVICNPPEAFKVRPDDLVFALKRAFWQWQPPLKTSRQTSRNRIIDLDVKSLEAKLKTLNEDVTNVREEYQGLILTVEGESADAVTPNEPDAETPLLPKDTGPISPLRKTSNVVEKKRVEDDLKVLETKLAAIKHDVAIMQARYLNFLNSS